MEMRFRSKEHCEMSGIKLLADTNVIIRHLAGDAKAEQILQGAIVYISAVSYAELLSGTLPAEEKVILQEYLAHVHLIHTNDFICETAASIRKQYKTKLPDALIAATSLFLQLPVVTFDSDFDVIADLRVIKLTIEI